MTEHDGVIVNLDICDAILTKHLLQYRDAVTGKIQIVEPHAYGVMHDGNHAIWVWPLGDLGSAPIEPVELVLIRLDEMRDVQIRNEIFEGRRPDYKRANKYMRLIHSQL
jgi:hypothetical protein